MIRAAEDAGTTSVQEMTEAVERARAALHQLADAANKNDRARAFSRVLNQLMLLRDQIAVLRVAAPPTQVPVPRRMAHAHVVPWRTRG
jgi:Spy/CpxP family protein refolding chaperone